MQIKLCPEVLRVPATDSFAVIHSPLGEASFYSNPLGGYRKYTGDVPLGQWETILFDSVEDVIPDEKPTGIAAASIPDVFSVFVWLDEDAHRIAVTPDNSPLYAPEAVHRLYWATDTRKLYQNIADTWQMIGTLKHDLLEDVGSLSHKELEKAIANVHSMAQVAYAEVSEW